MYKVIKRKGYRALIIHEDGDKLFIASPWFNEISDKFEAQADPDSLPSNRGAARIRANQVEDSRSFIDEDDAIRFIEDSFTSSHTKSMRNNPIENHLIKSFFGDAKEMKKVSDTMTPVNENIEALKKLIEFSQKLSMSLQYIANEVDAAAVQNNVTGVKDALVKVAAVSKAIVDHDLTKAVTVVAAQVKEFVVDQFNANEFLGLE